MKIWQARPQLVFTFDNRFSSTGWAVPQSVRYISFRLQASYLSATSHTGRKSCWSKVYIWNVFGQGSSRWRSSHSRLQPGDENQVLTNVKYAEKFFLGEVFAIPQSTFSIPSFQTDLPGSLYTCSPPPPPQCAPKNGPQAHKTRLQCSFFLSCGWFMNCKTAFDWGILYTVKNYDTSTFIHILIP
jgi:hypothetical protein